MATKKKQEDAAPPTDVRGKVFEVGQEVARAGSMYSVGGHYVEVAKVTRVENGRVFLNGSNIALRFPNRVAILGC